jgi:hypothetical protein
MPLICILNVPGSNSGHYTAHPDGGFVISSDLSGKKIMADPFRMSLSLGHSVVLSCTVLCSILTAMISLHCKLKLNLYITWRQQGERTHSSNILILVTRRGWVDRFTPRQLITGKGNLYPQIMWPFGPQSQTGAYVDFLTPTENRTTIP